MKSVIDGSLRDAAFLDEQRAKLGRAGWAYVFGKKNVLTHLRGNPAYTNVGTGSGHLKFQHKVTGITIGLIGHGREGETEAVRAMRAHLDTPPQPPPPPPLTPQTTSGLTQRRRRPSSTTCSGP